MMLTKRVRYLDWLALGLLLVLLAGYLVNLTEWRVHDDEGEYLYQVWRMTLGEVPYRDFLTPQLPVFLYSGRVVMGLVGASLSVMRGYNVLLTFATGILLYLAGRKHGNRGVGLLAMVLFLVHPDVFKECRIYRSEPTLLLLVTAGLVTATWTVDKGYRRNLALAGILFGLATMSKLFGLLPAVGVALWLVWDWVRGRRTFRETVANGLAFGLPLLLVVALIAGIFSLAVPGFWNLVLGHHLAQGGDLAADEVLGNKLGLFWRYLDLYPVFVPLALLSSGVGMARKDSRARWAWQIPTVVAFLLLSRELGGRHFMYLLPALSLQAAWLLAEGFASRRRWWLGVLSGAVLLAILVPAVDANAFRSGWQDTDTEQIVELIEEHTDPGDMILADDIGFGFYARRPIPYSGAALSHGAVTSGQITGELLVQEIVATNTRLVIMDQSLLTASHLVFLRDYPRFHRFLERNFELLGRFRRDYQELELWVRQPDRPFVTEDEFEIAQSDGTQFGETMTLLGYTLPAEPLEAGERLDFTLYWTSDAPADSYWSVFTHLIGPDGSLVGQHDKIPYDGLYPPNRWWPGQIIDDRYSISIPTDASAGEYRLAVGMYDWQTGERLMLRTAGGDSIPDNRLLLEKGINVVLAR
jgi:hypothetical protein